MFRTLLLPSCLESTCSRFVLLVAAFIKQHIQANYVTAGNFFDYSERYLPPE